MTKPKTNPSRTASPKTPPPRRYIDGDEVPVGVHAFLTGNTKRDVTDYGVLIAAYEFALDAITAIRNQPRCSAAVDSVLEDEADRLGAALDAIRECLEEYQADERWERWERAAILLAHYADGKEFATALKLCADVVANYGTLPDPPAT